MDAPKPVTLEELKDLLGENLEATEENTKILKGMRRDAIIGGVLKFLFWIAVIGISFYFTAQLIEPYLTSLTGADSMKTEDFQALFELYKKELGQ